MLLDWTPTTILPSLCTAAPITFSYLGAPSLVRPSPRYTAPFVPNDVSIAPDGVILSRKAPSVSASGGGGAFCAQLENLCPLSSRLPSDRLVVVPRNT